MLRPEQIRDRCCHCGRKVATYVPKGGDGSQRQAYRHTSASNGADVPCPGSGLATVKWGDGAV